MSETPSNIDAMTAAVDGISDQLCRTVDGDFNLRIAAPDSHPSVQKLALMVNFLLDNVRRAMAAQEVQTRELAEAKARAEDADRAKTNFLSVVSHEFRTPLNGVLGGAHMLSRSEDPVAGAAANIIEQSGKRLLDLVDELLLFIRVASGEETELALREASAEALLAQACELASGTLASRKASLETECAPGLVLLLDQRIAARALAGLIENAALASDAGQTIRLSAFMTGRDAVITVADQGCGMSEDETRRALAPFAQAREGATRARDGLGLGLPLAIGFAELHGGKLEIDSTPGEGATVRLVLPSKAARGDTARNQAA